MEQKNNTLEIPPHITQEEKNKFKHAWSVQYIEKLKEKEKKLEMLIESNGHACKIGLVATDYEKHLEIINWELELLELKNKIFFEKVVLRDWLNRAIKQSGLDEADIAEAKEKMDGLLQIARDAVKKDSENPHDFEGQMVTAINMVDRIRDLLNKYETVNIHDNSQLVQYYKSLKVELQKQKIL